MDKGENPKILPDEEILRIKEDGTPLYRNDDVEDIYQRPNTSQSPEKPAKKRRSSKSYGSQKGSRHIVTSSQIPQKPKEPEQQTLF